MGYRNRTIRKDFDDLGDDIWVSIRNPKLLPLDKLTPEDIPVGPNGEPRKDDMLAATNALIAGVIATWSVPDPGDDRDDAPSMPLSAESVGKLPVEILSWIQEQITQALTGRKDDPQDHLMGPDNFDRLMAQVDSPN